MSGLDLTFSEAAGIFLLTSLLHSTLAVFLTGVVHLPSNLLSSDLRHTFLTVDERDALLAHELIHISQRDACWNLIIQIVRRVLFFQPLNILTGQQLRREMDFVADLHAVVAVGQRSALASCLVRLAAQLPCPARLVGQFSLVAGMASFRTTLGRRVETLLDPTNFGRWVADSALVQFPVFLSRQS